MRITFSLKELIELFQKTTWGRSMAAQLSDYMVHFQEKAIVLS